MKYRVKPFWRILDGSEAFGVPFASEAEAKRHCAALNAAARGGSGPPAEHAKGVSLAAEIAAEKRFDNPLVKSSLPLGRWATPPAHSMDDGVVIEPGDLID